MEYSYEIYHGQQRINGELCRVDWKLIKALRMIHEILATLRPPVRDQLLEALKAAIEDADLTSSKVASIKPPGCDPENREDGETLYEPPPSSTP
jgi:hypothetical protein